MAYEPLVYKTSGGDQLTVSTGGVINITGGTLKIAGTDFITSGGNVVIGSLTSGSITTTGSLTASSGVAGSSGTFTGGVAASTGTFSGGIVASSGGFTNGLSMSSAGVTNQLAAGSIVMTSGLYFPVEHPATGVANPFTIAPGGLTEVWSSGSDSTAGRRFNLPAPVAGLEKWVVCVKSTSGAPAILSATGPSALIYPGGYSIGIFTSGAAEAEWVHLIGVGATTWYLVGCSTRITWSTT